MTIQIDVKKIECSSEQPDATINKIELLLTVDPTDEDSDTYYAKVDYGADTVNVRGVVPTDIIDRVRQYKYVNSTNSVGAMSLPVPRLITVYKQGDGTVLRCVKEF